MKHGGAPAWAPRVLGVGILAVALAVCCLALPASSGAQSPAPPERVIVIAPEMRAREFSEITRGLLDAGVRAMSVEDAGLDATFAACRVMACVARAANASGSRAAFASLRHEDGSEPSLLWVLVEADGGRAQARVRVARGELWRAVASAWRETSLELVLGSDSLIRLVTTPSGANVWLDDVPLGTTPFAERVAPGEHRIRAALEGFVAQEQSIQARAGRAHQLQMRLSRSPSFEQRDQPPAASVPSPWNFILGGSLALLATPALITAVNTLANDGQCVEYAGDGRSCRERARFGSQSALVLVLGVVGFSAGAAIFSLQPFAPAVDHARAAPNGRQF